MTAVTGTVAVGLLGLGTVGAAVARRLIGEWELLGQRAGAIPVLRQVAVRDPARDRDLTLPRVQVGSDPLRVVEDPEVELVVEVMGGMQPATSCIERALLQGKSVVTANKAVIAEHGPRLAALAAAHGAGLWFEAAVGAGLPLLALLRDSLRADRIRSLDAVINGTTNVILTRMHKGETLGAALAEARRRGFAEADASIDIEGWDAAHKLVIMCWLAFGARLAPAAVDRRGIAGLDAADLGHASRLGHAVKLVARARQDDGRLRCSVRPTLVPPGCPLHDVDDSANCVLISSDLAADVQLRGLGAGGDSTASAVLSDVVQAVRRRGCPPPPPPAAELPLRDAEDSEVRGYLRILLQPSPEAAELVVQALEDRGVPVDAVYEPEPRSSPPAELLLLTGSAPRAVHDRALETLDTLAAVRGIACSLDRL